MSGVSVLIPARDEATDLPACLESCAFADEIVVVDSGSVDGTADLARAAGARVLVRPFDTHARQKNWALPQLAHDWVLAVDADERVTPELAAEIPRALASAGAARGFVIPRRNTFLGREIRGCGWQHDRVLRLFDRRHARYDDRRVHESVQVDGAVARLTGALRHHSCRDLSEWLRKTERYAHLGAEEAFAAGRRARATDLAVRPAGRFLKQWLLQAGFRDGVEGWLLCATSAYGVLLKYARLRELARGTSR